MNLNFFTFFASACPYFRLFFTLWNRMEYTAFCICVCWLRSVNVIFLIPLRQDELNQNFLRICLYHRSCRMADNRSSFPEGPNRKKNLFAITQCSHGKTKAPLFVSLLKARKDPSTKGRQKSLKFALLMCILFKFKKELITKDFSVKMKYFSEKCTRFQRKLFFCQNKKKPYLTKITPADDSSFLFHHLPN